MVCCCHCWRGRVLSAGFSVLQRIGDLSEPSLRHWLQYAVRCRVLLPTGGRQPTGYLALAGAPTQLAAMANSPRARARVLPPQVQIISDCLRTAAAARACIACTKSIRSELLEQRYTDDEDVVEEGQPPSRAASPPPHGKASGPGGKTQPRRSAKQVRNSAFRSSAGPRRLRGGGSVPPRLLVGLCSLARPLTRRLTPTNAAVSSKPPSSALCTSEEISKCACVRACVRACVCGPNAPSSCGRKLSWVPVSWSPWQLRQRKHGK
jgi:hypothetical protein